LKYLIFVDILPQNSLFVKSVHVKKCRLKGRNVIYNLYL